MKSRFLVVIFILALSGCATTSGGSSIFAPRVVAGNERYVTLYDPIGLPGHMEVAADEYCARYNRFAQFQSIGGSTFQCSGRSVNLCATFNCVQ